MLLIGSNGRTLLLSFVVSLIPGVWCGFACLSNPCLHGVCIDDLNSTYFCYCIDGYTGIQCQTNWNECWSQPCQNGATCIDGIAIFNCSCPPGFIGDLCEENFNECESNPCQNNGTCVDGTNGYTCNCLPGYSGVECEIDETVCNSTNETRCDNGGICVDGPGNSFSCRCAPGWEGFLCEVETNECISAPCQNGGICIDGTAEYSCACIFGYTGQNCELTVQICNVNPCKNGGLCLMEGYHQECYCVPDFHGDLCQFQYDECQLGQSCKNGGSCIDGIDNFTCSCPPRLTGQYCECLILDNDFDCTYISPRTTLPTTFSTIVSLMTEKGTTVFGSTIVPNFTTPVFTTTVTPMTTLDITSTSPPTTTSTTSTSTIATTSTQTTSISTTTETPTTITITTSETPTTTITTTEEISTTTEFETTTTENPTSTTTEIISTTTSTTSIPTTIPTETTSTEGTTLTQPVVITKTSPPTFPTTTITSLPTSTLESTTTSMFEETATSVPTYFTEKPTTPAIFLDCMQNHCQNGGTCVYYEGTYKCVCPFDTEGDLCEVQLGVTNAAFSGESYLVHKINFYNSTLIEFEAKTLSPTGLVLYLELDSLYMALYLEEGYLKFKFSCGYQTMLLSELKVPINNGYPFKVKASLDLNKDLKHCDASIKVNESISMMGDQMTLLNNFSKNTANLYFGGVPSDFLNLNLPLIGFVGCVSNLTVLGQHLGVFKEASDGFKITECSSLVCLLNPCQNGAPCLSDNGMFKCNCKNGYLGTRCERSVCEDNPCHFGATCVPFSGSGYICLCPFGKHGHFCENDLKISQPYFSSSLRGLSSYVAYRIPEGISRKMELKFRIKPSTLDQIAILMFIGQDGVHDFYSDHLAISFVKGYIMLTWNLGSGPRRIFTPKPLKNDTREYLIKVGYLGKKAWLFVEDIGNVTGRSPGNLVQLDVAPILYIGGHISKNFTSLPHDLPLHSGFSGCIYDIQLIFDNLIIALSGTKVLSGRAVGQCSTTECLEQICQNGGVCLHHASTFMCLCQDLWYGPLCSLRYNPCDIHNHNCSEGSTCVPLMSGYECDCPFGKTGNFCEKAEDITDVSFTGMRSFIALNPLKLDKSRFNIEMGVRPLSDNGLVLFLQENENKFISLYLQSGVLELNIIWGKLTDLLSLSSTKILNKGVWYKVQFGVFGKKVYLSVDGVVSTGILKSNDGVTLVNDHIFFGGVADMSVLPPIILSDLPTHFVGCINHFTLDYIHIPLTEKNIKTGRNVIDCDGTPCGKDACENGGTCWLDSSSKPHCSCLTPYYGEKCELLASCEARPCQHSGKCYKSRCICNVGYNGAFCENIITVKKPEFEGNSFLILKKNDKKRNIKEANLDSIYINFTTPKNDGILLWTKNDKSFAGLGVENGFLKLVYSGLKNGDFMDIRIHPQINDGLWHSIKIKFNPFEIKLDNFLVNYNKGKKLDANISTNGVFYLGGFPSDKVIENFTNGFFKTAFEGCVERVGTNLEQIQDFTQYEGTNIDVCRI